MSFFLRKGTSLSQFHMGWGVRAHLNPLSSIYCSTIRQVYKHDKPQTETHCRSMPRYVKYNKPENRLIFFNSLPLYQLLDQLSKNMFSAVVIDLYKENLGFKKLLKY